MAEIIELNKLEITTEPVSLPAELVSPHFEPAIPVEPLPSLIETMSMCIEPVPCLVEPASTCVTPLPSLVNKTPISIEPFAEPPSSPVEPLPSLVEPASSPDEPASAHVTPLSSLVKTASISVEPVAEPVSSPVELASSPVEAVSSPIEPVTSLVESTSIPDAAIPVEPMLSLVEPVSSPVPISLPVESVPASIPDKPVSSLGNLKYRYKFALFLTGLIFSSIYLIIPIALYATGSSATTHNSECPLNLLHQFGECQSYSTEICDGNIQQDSKLTLLNNLYVEQRNLIAILNISISTKNCTNNPMFYYCTEVNMCNEINNLHIESQNLFLSAAQDCNKLKDGMCEDRWNETSSNLSNCSTYYIQNESSPVCPDQFGVFCNTLCLPLCNEFSQNENSVTYAIDSLIKLNFFIANLISCLVIVVSILMKRKKIFGFHNVSLLIYIPVIIAIQGLLMILPLFSKENYFCYKRSLFASIINSSTYCQMQGFLLEATTIWLVGSMLLDDIYIYIILHFVFSDFHTFQSRRNKLFHIFLVVCIFTLGWVGPIISITTNGYQIADFPPTQCVSQSEVLFYAVILPISAMSTAGITINLLIYHVLLKHIFSSLITKKKKLARQIVRSAIQLFNHSVILVVIILFFSLCVHNKSKILDATVNYSNCVLLGMSCDEKRENIITLSTPAVTLAYHICPLFVHLTALLSLGIDRDIFKAFKKITGNAHTSFISSSNDERLAVLGLL